MEQRTKTRLRLIVGGMTIYGICAYVITPRLWRHYEHHPALARAPKTSTTAEGIPGDPLNIGLIGSQDEVIRLFLAAGWHPAEPITLHSSLGIIGSVLLRRQDESAPVSSLYLWGRKQDLAFEQEVGRSAARRHHVRLWQSPERRADGRPVWLGAATFDIKVGFSHRTGQITHHIAPDIDQQRDSLMGDLERTQQLTKLYQVTGVGPTLQGRNGGGDWYYTDGELTMAVIAKSNQPQAAPPVALPNPPVDTLKNRVWQQLRRVLPK